QLRNTSSIARFPPCRSMSVIEGKAEGHGLVGHCAGSPFRPARLTISGPSQSNDQTPMRKNDLANRERKARRLAEKMYFKLEREGERYTLWSTAGIPEPIRREHLGIDEVEKELELWKLRGPSQ